MKSDRCEAVVRSALEDAIHNPKLAIDAYHINDAIWVYKGEAFYLNFTVYALDVGDDHERTFHPDDFDVTNFGFEIAIHDWIVSELYPERPVRITISFP